MAFPLSLTMFFVFIYSHWLCQDWFFQQIDDSGFQFPRDSFVCWRCCRIMWSKPDTCAESLRKLKSKPLLYPHSSHLTHTLSFLLSLILFIHIWRSNRETIFLASSKWAFLDIALCVYPHCKVSIGQYTKMCTSAFIFFQLHYFRCQIFEENIWSLSLSLYIWPLESWTIIAIIRFNSILRMIWGRVEC